MVDAKARVSVVARFLPASERRQEKQDVDLNHEQQPHFAQS